MTRILKTQQAAIKWMYGGCSFPNLSDTLIPAADDIAVSNLKLKRPFPVPGRVELLSICQGACLKEKVVGVITSFPPQMRPTHACIWTLTNAHKQKISKIQRAKADRKHRCQVGAYFI